MYQMEELWKGKKNGLQRSMRKFGKIMDISIILTVLHVYLHVKIYQDLHTKYMQFIISQSYVNKAVKI